MSDNFKFLTQATENSDTSTKAFAQEDAAQSFLDEKLAKNRFTTKQQDTLDANGGSSVATETKFNKVIANQDAIDSHAEASSAGGRLTAEQIRQQFSLDFNEGHASGSGNKYGADDSTGALYHKETGEYIGTLKGYKRNDKGHKTKDGDGFLRHDDGVNGLKAMQDHGIKHGIGRQRTKWNSINDVAGAANDIMGKDLGAAPEAVFEDVPIEHSPEIKQAKERVKTYENDVLSGKVSDDIYDSDKYSFDATKGAAGIGTPMSGGAPQQALKATASFLDNKKSQVKDKYQFQAQG